MTRSVPPIRGLASSVRRPGEASGRVAQTAITNVVLALLGIATGSIAARILGPQGRGTLAAIQLWPMLFAKIATLGLLDSLVFFIARDASRAASLLSSGLILTLIASIPVGVCAYLLTPVILADHSPQVVQLARLYAVAFVPLVCLSNMPLFALKGRNEFTTWNALWIVHHGAWLVVLVAAWAVDQTRADLVAFGYLVALSGSALLNLLVARRKLEGSLRPDPATWKRLLGFGIPSAVGNTAEFINFRIDQLVLVLVFPPQVLGVYVAAVAWGVAARPLMTAVGTVFFPHVAMTEEIDERQRAFGGGVRLAVSLAISLIAILFALTPLAVPLLFGPDFAGAIRPALLLVIGGTLWGLNGIIEEGFRGLGKPGIVMRAESIGVAVTVVLLPMLVWRFDLIGAAAASLTGYLMTTAYLMTRTSRETRLPLRRVVTPDIRGLMQILRVLLRHPAGPSRV